MAHLQYRKSSYHELSWIEIKRRLQIDNAQLSAIEQFIDQEFIRSGLPQSGPNMAAPPFEHHKPLLEFVLDEATQVFNITVPAETTVDDARNALRAVVHNIRRRQRDRNSRRKCFTISPISQPDLQLLTWHSAEGQEKSQESSE